MTQSDLSRECKIRLFFFICFVLVSFEDFFFSLKLEGQADLTALPISQVSLLQLEILCLCCI